MPAGFVATSLRASAQGINNPGETLEVTLYRNGSPTALTLTLTSVLGADTIIAAVPYGPTDQYDLRSSSTAVGSVLLVATVQ